jgi:hypothetical protein
MVSKLLLAVQDTFFRALNSGASRRILEKLAWSYYDIRSGIGDYKTPEVYGAFPMDPYSHTPAHAGARQPGMTGQVKEDFLCRMGELGVLVRNGQIRFRPALLREEEFVSARTDFRFYDVAGNARRIKLPAGSLAFTYCQVPIVYNLAHTNGVRVFFENAPATRVQELALDTGTSRLIFERAGRVRRIDVLLAGNEILAQRSN